MIGTSFRKLSDSGSDVLLRKIRHHIQRRRNYPEQFAAVVMEPVSELLVDRGLSWYAKSTRPQPLAALHRTRGLKPDYQLVLVDSDRTIVVGAVKNSSVLGGQSLINVIDRLNLRSLSHERVRAMIDLEKQKRMSKDESLSLNVGVRHRIPIQPCGLHYRRGHGSHTIPHLSE